MARRAVPPTEALVPIRRDICEINPLGPFPFAAKKTPSEISRPRGTGVSVRGTGRPVKLLVSLEMRRGRGQGR